MEDTSFKREVFANLKKNGMLDEIKSQLRAQLLNRLQGKFTTGSAGALSGEAKSEESTKFKRRIICSLIGDYLQKENLLYSQSVFVPETGFSQSLFSVTELEQFFKLPKNPSEERCVLDFMVGGMLDISLGGYKDRSEQFVQTEDLEDNLTLDQKLKKIDNEYLAAQITERQLPFRELEERMIKYKREVDTKMRLDLAAEVSKVREIEIASIKLEESAKYRTKMKEYRNELEQIHKEKLEKLKQRETEVQEKCKRKEQDLEKAILEHRQTVMRDMELIQIRENEIKKGLEVRLREVELEKIRMKELQNDYELKAKVTADKSKNLDEELLLKIEEYIL
jgi:oral-facial-digital syndrome 1 protein